MLMVITTVTNSDKNSVTAASRKLIAQSIERAFQLKLYSSVTCFKKKMNLRNEHFEMGPQRSSVISFDIKNLWI